MPSRPKSVPSRLGPPPQLAAQLNKIPIVQQQEKFKPKMREILSKREAIFAAPKSEIKRNRVSKVTAVEDSLIEWFDKVRDENATITHKILRAKTEELAKKLGHGDFTASSGWLSRLLKRRDISCKKQHGESRSSDFKQGQTG